MNDFLSFPSTPSLMPPESELYVEVDVDVV